MNIDKSIISFYSNSTNGVPRDISSSLDAEKLAIIEYFMPLDFKDRIITQEICLINSVKLSNQCFDHPINSIILTSNQTGMGGKVQKYLGAWGRLPNSIRDSGVFDELNSIETSFDGISSYWGIAKIVQIDPQTIMKSMNSYSGIIISSNNKIDIKKFESIAQTIATKDHTKALHVAVRYALHSESFALWRFPVFDDRGISIFLISTITNIEKLRIINGANWSV